MALTVALARHDGVDLSGLATDWSKCYDHVWLELIPAVAARAGIPAAFWRPVYDMYCAPRAVLLEGLLGEWRSPSHGIPPGCPAAVEWISLLAYMLTTEHRLLHQAVRARPYVDDLTSSARSAPQPAQLVTDLWSTTLAFGGAFGWKLQPSKCNRFSTSAAVRLDLRTRAGPPVAPVFKDLGIAQHTSNSRDNELALQRDQAALDKLFRIQAVDWSFRQRCWLVAASPVPTSLFGVAAVPMSNRRLRAQRSAVMHALWRSGSRAAPELLFTLLAPWRADPMAVSVVTPWTFLRQALLNHVITEDDADELILRSTDRVGPVAAARDALRRAGLQYGPGVNLVCGRVSLRLVDAPAKLLQMAVLTQYRAQQLIQVCDRRPFFRPLRDGVDHQLSMAPYRAQRPRRGPHPGPGAVDLKPLTEAQAACLRLLNTGGAFTQSTVARWKPGGDLCPHCRLARESLKHRLLWCPRWDLLRLRHLKGQTVPSLLAVVPEITMLTGLVPVDAALLAAQRTAEAAATWPAPMRLAGRSWSDGAATDPQDALLRRAAWAVVHCPDRDFVVAVSAGVPGRQTAARAELCALIWASRCDFADTLVTDNWGVHTGAEGWVGRSPAQLLEGVNGDLWRLLLRQVNTQWTRSHLSLDEALAAGFTEVDHAGNAAADAEASRLARALAPSGDTRADRVLLRRHARQAQHMIAAVQEAVLAASVRRGPRRRRKRFHAPRGLTGPSRPLKPLRQVTGLAPPPGLHHLAIFAGPVGRDMADSAQPRLSWALQCMRCAKVVTGTSRWTEFAKTVCRAAPLAGQLGRATAAHDMSRLGRGWVCCRCGLTCTAARRAAMARATCPVPDCLGPDGTVILTARPWMAEAVGLAQRWRDWVRAQPAMPAAPAAPPPPRVLALAWRPHWVVRSPLKQLCLQCGALPRTRDPRRLQGEPCPGQQALSAAARLALRSGLFDQALGEAQPEWRERAAARG